MDKSTIKNFAVWARNKLIADITYKASLLGVTEAGINAALPQSTKDVEFYDIGTKEPYAITGEALRQRKQLAERIAQKAKESDYKTAYRSVLEEVAYTWFNRLIAIRFMEVNDYLPSRIRVLSAESGTKLEPDLVTTPFEAELALSDYDKAEIVRLKTENQVDELFRLLFIRQCNALNAILPKLFEKTADYTELLLNVSVTDQDGVVYHLVHDIAEEDFNIEKGGQVEIIGWLYQYYNTEPKDEAFALLKKNVKITKERIPAATQLFTPDWIVRYMVENSLGRLWVEGHPNAELKAGWKYYLEEAQQEPEVEAQLAKIREEYKALRPEDIKVIDPCMGSGHILVYAFDVLMQIYEAAGYAQRDAAKSILEHNLYGLDIDDRAFQLAYFAVMMKARQYNRRILNGEIDCHVYAIQESNNLNREQLKYFGSGFSDSERYSIIIQINELLDNFVDSKEYGSILKVGSYNWSALKCFIASYELNGQIAMDAVGIESTQNELKQLITIAEVMQQKYDIVITNPPYFGFSRFSAKLANYVEKNYPDSKVDLSVAMLEQAVTTLCKKVRFVSFITTNSWMFLSSFEKARSYILDNCGIDSVVDFGTELFEGKVGHNPIVAFVLRNVKVFKKATAIRLVDYCYARRNEKEQEFYNKNNYYYTTQNLYYSIPGVPIAYWLTERVFWAFANCKNIKEIAKARSGAKSGKNEKFIMCWWEIDRTTLSVSTASFDDCCNSPYKWFPHNKGGNFRNWYGNRELVIRFEKGGNVIKEYGDANGCAYDLNAKDVYFHCGLTWTALTSYKNSFRYSPTGCVFDTNKGPMLFNESQDLLFYLLGFFISPVAQYILKALNPSLSLQNGDVDKVPIIIDEKVFEDVVTLSKRNVSIAKADYDEKETSWDFICPPLCRYAKQGSLKKAYELYEKEKVEDARMLRSNQEKIDTYFINLYGLSKDMFAAIPDKDIEACCHKANRSVEVRNLISYAVGCIFGRFSLEGAGVIYAGGRWDDSAFSSFTPDSDNIIPITDEEYFNDDIVDYFCKWLTVTFGARYLDENLDFIARAIDEKGSSSRQIMRKYFLNCFYKDHCSVYQAASSGKRPIYWLFDSGKQNGFKALIYLHRYDENTIGNLRIDYLHRMERVYESEIARMQDAIDNGSTAREVTAAAKRREKLVKQLKECRDYDEKIAHLALARISLDLDDGVKANYRKLQTGTDGKFYEVLADSKDIMAKE